ncbi:hypothetical protein HDU96_007846 [Phlyctochytrium bullatum]|nr:hypothetical protein HDU96_007846 [Phlyctochytrium bullatum]
MASNRPTPSALPHLRSPVWVLSLLLAALCAVVVAEPFPTVTARNAVAEAFDAKEVAVPPQGLELYMGGNVTALFRRQDICVEIDPLEKTGEDDESADDDVELDSSDPTSAAAAPAPVSTSPAAVATSARATSPATSAAAASSPSPAPSPSTTSRSTTVSSVSSVAPVSSSSSSSSSAAAAVAPSPSPVAPAPVAASPSPVSAAASPTTAAAVATTTASTNATTVTLSRGPVAPGGFVWPASVGLVYNPYVVAAARAGNPRSGSVPVVGEGGVSFVFVPGSAANEAFKGFWGPYL